MELLTRKLMELLTCKLLAYYGKSLIVMILTKSRWKLACNMLVDV